MKSKKIVGFFLFFLIFFSLSALEVSENELKNVPNADTIVFENYTGPHSVINSASQIRGIGSSLGTQIAKNAQESRVVGNAQKYSVLHLVDSSGEKLGADILILGENAAVDHIRNLRWIISAYLSSAYNYSRKDSETLATFITVYNAVYRSNLEYFQSKYKKIVTENLSKEKAGISVSYREWPGKTQIVIPLSGASQGLSVVETSIISDKQIVQSMQEKAGKGIDERKQMVDIKEREADAAQEKADEAQKRAMQERDLAQKEAKNAEQKSQEAQKAQEEAQKAKLEAEAAQKIADENPNDEEAQKMARQKQEEAQEAQNLLDEANLEAEAAQNRADEAQNRAEKTELEAETAQATADQKRSEAQAERTAIAQDQNQVVREQTKNENSATTFGLKVLDETGELSGIVLLNAETGKTIRESPVTVIRNRTLLDAGENFVAIAGITEGNGAVKLVQIDKKTMEIKKESAETISPVSVLAQDSGEYYCVINEGANFVLAKYSADLTLLLKSKVFLKAASPVTIDGNAIMVTTSDNRAVLLRAGDLSEINQ